MSGFDYSKGRPLNQNQFPVVRREDGRYMRFVAVDDSIDDIPRPVGVIDYQGGQWNTPSDAGYQHIGDTADYGTQLRMFYWRRGEGLDTFAVHPEYQGRGIGQDLVNRAVEEHWRQNPGERDTVPPHSSDLTNRSRDFVEASTGEVPQHYIWEHDDSAADDWAADVINQRGSEIAWSADRDAGPGDVVGEDEYGSVIRVDYEPTSSLSEKSDLLKHGSEPEPEPEPEPEKPEYRQMRLPGTYTRSLP